MIINIANKKNQVRELIKQSSFCKLLDVQDKLLHNIKNLPDEIDEADIGLLNAVQTIIESAENNSNMQETVKIFLRLDTIRKRRIVEPNAVIDDLI